MTLSTGGMEEDLRSSGRRHSSLCTGGVHRVPGTDRLENGTCKSVTGGDSFVWTEDTVNFFYRGLGHFYTKFWGLW